MISREAPIMAINVNDLLALLRELHGLDRETIAAMAFERSRQHNVTLIQAFADVVAELDRVADTNPDAADDRV
jgi:hypothetical protein